MPYEIDNFILNKLLGRLATSSLLLEIILSEIKLSHLHRLMFFISNRIADIISQYHIKKIKGEYYPNLYLSLTFSYTYHNFNYTLKVFKVYKTSSITLTFSFTHSTHVNKFRSYNVTISFYRDLFYLVRCYYQTFSAIFKLHYLDSFLFLHLYLH